MRLRRSIVVFSFLFRKQAENRNLHFFTKPASFAKYFGIQNDATPAYVL